MCVNPSGQPRFVSCILTVFCTGVCRSEPPLGKGGSKAIRYNPVPPCGTLPSTGSQQKDHATAQPSLGLVSLTCLGLEGGRRRIPAKDSRGTLAGQRRKGARVACGNQWSSSRFSLPKDRVWAGGRRLLAERSDRPWGFPLLLRAALTSGPEARTWRSTAFSAHFLPLFPAFR